MVSSGAIAEGMKRLADPSQEDRFVDAVRLRRMGTVDDIGQAVVFLASLLASYITSCVLVCDRGQNLAGSPLSSMGAEKMLLTQAARAPG